jgi:Arf-GAP with coiled-coil, ANK repeat and PH domain-containing protein
MQCTTLAAVVTEQEKKDSRDTPQNTVALQTATVKPGAEEAADAELQFCFRVVSPTRSYVLQAADDLEATEWMECIQVMLVEV